MIKKEHAFQQIEPTPEFQERLRSLIKLAGGLRAAARLVGVHFDTVGRWRDGQQKMPFQAAVMLCRAAGVSLDWLAFGEGDFSVPQGGTSSHVVLVDIKALKEAAEFVIRATIAIEGLKTDATSEAIADAIVRRAFDVEGQRYLRNAKTRDTSVDQDTSRNTSAEADDPEQTKDPSGSIKSGNRLE